MHPKPPVRDHFVDYRWGWIAFATVASQNLCPVHEILPHEAPHPPWAYMLAQKSQVEKHV